VWVSVQGVIETMAPKLSPGTTFAGYQIEDVAGSGGMGIVYKATQIALGRRVALKLIAADLARDASFRERFKREWLTAASIDHPNVIPLYEAGEADEHLFIAMRYVEGLDLAALIAREPSFDPARAVNIVAQIASALDAAHKKGLVHRDVKPANILIASQDDHVYLTDFGLTKSATSQSALTKTGMFVGSLDYTAPEQIRGEAADPRTDVYSLGCVLYQALTALLPYDRDSDVAKMYAHLNEEPPSVTAARPGAPAGLDAVVARAMAKEPADRYQTAGELGRAALAALQGELPETPRESPWPRRKKIALATALPTVLVAGLAAAGLAAAGVFGGGDEPVAQAPTATPTATAQAKATATPTATATAAPAGDPHAVATIKVGKGPGGIAVSAGRVFVADREAGALSVIDGDTNKVTATAEAGKSPDGVVAGKDVVWMTDPATNTVQRLEARDQLVPTANIKVGAGPEGISLGKQLVWVANRKDGTVNRIDRASPSLVGSPIGVGNLPTGIFVGRRTVWVTNNADGTVTRIDPSTAQVLGDPIGVGKDPRGVIEDGDSVWIANAGDDTVTRIDRKTAEVVGDPIKVGDNPREIAVGLGFVWVANQNDNTVTRIDPVTGKVAGASIPVGNRPSDVAVGGGAVWVANEGDDTVTRIEL
jgi:YVTN family beta-propeller protein